MNEERRQEPKRQGGTGRKKQSGKKESRFELGMDRLVTGEIEKERKGKERRGTKVYNMMKITHT